MVGGGGVDGEGDSSWCEIGGTRGREGHESDIVMDVGYCRWELCEWDELGRLVVMERESLDTHWNV